MEQEMCLPTLAELPSRMGRRLKIMNIYNGIYIYNHHDDLGMLKMWGWDMIFQTMGFLEDDVLSLAFRRARS